MTINKHIRWMAMAAAITVSAQEFTAGQRETFLRTASVMSRKELSMGVTGSMKAELNDGNFSHAAHVQTVDIYKATFQTPRGSELNFRDSFKYNVAGYELAKLLDLDMVPASVERKVAGQGAAVTWWVDNVAMTELDRQKKGLEAPDQSSWNRQMHVIRAFDELIFNTDRNMGNLVITRDWEIWMIDHTRAFRMHRSCANVKSLRQIDRSLLSKMRELNREVLREKVGAYLNKQEIEGLLARRDQIVRHFESEIAARGETAVLFELGRR